MKNGKNMDNDACARMRVCAVYQCHKFANSLFLIGDDLCCFSNVSPKLSCLLCDTVMVLVDGSIF